MRNINKEDSAERTLSKKTALERIMGRSIQVWQMRNQIKTVAACDVSVLINGECGTGKELAARAIHSLGKRSIGPFIPVNCGAIPENLFENELFGHRKGAFTDASLHQDGLVKEAEGGTLFLDEIGVITPYIQVKLLRLLQDKEYKPLGDSRPRKADIRIIAATNLQLQTLVGRGKFREDLFYRLNVVTLDIPPLRERRVDIPLLANFFVNTYSKEYAKPVNKIGDDAMVCLSRYRWPGNIRQLENLIQQAVVMTENRVIHLTDLQLPNTDETVAINRSAFTPDTIGHYDSAMSEGDNIEFFKKAKRKAIEDFEKNYLTEVMTAVRGNVVHAARKAGKSRTAFWNLLTKYRLHPRQFQSLSS